MDGSDDPMSEKEREELYSSIRDELPEDAQVMELGGEQSEEEWREMMPDEQPGLPVRIVGMVFKLVVLTMVLSPAILFLLVSFEAGVVAFMVVMLFFAAHVI